MMEKLEELYQNTRLDHFVMAISHLMNIGWQKAESITDEQLERCRGNGIMTKDFVIELNKTTREIAKCCEPSELICFCMYHDIFDTNLYFDDARENKIKLAIEAIDDLNDEYEINDNDLSYVLENYLAEVNDKKEE